MHESKQSNTINNEFRKPALRRYGQRESLGSSGANSSLTSRPRHSTRSVTNRSGLELNKQERIKLGHANLDLGVQFRVDRGSSSRPQPQPDAQAKSRKTKPSTPPAPAAATPNPTPPSDPVGIIHVPKSEAKKLQKHAEQWHDRQSDFVGPRIEALEALLGIDRNSKARTRGARSKSRGGGGAAKKIANGGDQNNPKTQRDEKQLECWKAIRDTLGELSPDESLCDALEMLYLGLLVNQVQQLEAFNGTQTRLFRLREKCQKRRNELKRVELELEEIEKALEQKDDEMRTRFWRLLKYYRYFRNFEDGET